MAKVKHIKKPLNQKRICSFCKGSGYFLVNYGYQVHIHCCIYGCVAKNLSK